MNSKDNIADFEKLIPVIIIGGFLGAGKTTLLNYILSENHGVRAGVLVNDFGAINIDAKLVVGVEGETVNLANGCVCCSTRDDLNIVKAQINLIAPGSRSLEACHCRVPLELLMGTEHWEAKNTKGWVLPVHSDPAHGHSFSTWHWTSGKPLSLPRLRYVFETLPGTVYRAKGIVYIEELPAYRVMLQMVGKRSNLKDAGQWGPSERLQSISNESYCDSKAVNMKTNRERRMKMITQQPVNNHDDMQKVVDSMLGEIGLSRGELDGKLTFAGLDPIMNTTLKVGAAGGILGAVNSLASAIIWQMRSGEGQDIHADLRKTYAIQSAYNPGMEKYSMINGYSVLYDADSAAFSGILPTKDNRFVFLAALYPRQRYNALNLLRCGNSMDALKLATRKWNAEDLEAAAMDAMVPIHKIRTQKEFQATEHWEHHAGTPLIHIEKIGDSDPEPFTPAERPLSGIRAMGFWHVIAGPTIARQLAAQGADCMNLCKPQWHADKMMYFTAEAGTRQAMLDASKPENRDQVYRLVKDADVFIENLRPGLADSEGYSAEQLAEYRPGLIYVQDKLNVATGPWSGWPGFDMSAGALTGIFTDADGTPDAPANPSTWVVNDFLTGYLGAIGAQAALIRRAQEGGSYRVKVTLAQCATFMLGMGLVDKNMLLDRASLGEEHQAMEPNTQTGQTPFGKLTRLGSQIEMSKTPEYWEDPILHVMGSSMPEWLPR